jgi:ABC-type phosphate/phosphonate transport system substrate-binding protein
MIASLGMYDRPECQPANDRLWALIRDGLRAEGLAAPETLTCGAGAYWPAWESPDLLLSQTCGFPYRAKLHGKVTLIGTPDFEVDGCDPGHYRSIMVARKSDARDALPDFHGARLAFNENLSQSGWAAPQNHAISHDMRLLPHLQTGGHLASARAVAEGLAEIAAIDAVTWSMIAEWEAFAANLKVVGQTEPTPGLPYIAGPGQDAERLFTVISAAIAALSPEDRDTLRLRGLVRIPPETYLAVPTPPTPEDLGYSAPQTA